MPFILNHEYKFFIPEKKSTVLQIPTAIFQRQFSGKYLFGRRFEI